jgi:MoaA/NifB/PqqE/SkfB family radical SAM enzyme
MQIPNSLKKFGIEQAVNYITKDPEKNLPKLMDWVDKFANGEFVSQRNAIRTAINDPDHVYHKLIMHLVRDIDREELKTAFVNFFLNSNLIGWDKQEAIRDKYHCNVPWAILLDPTSACNLHCTGCWAAEYGNKLNLTFDEIDDIIRQGKEMGVYMYIYTGGEPLVRKKDLIKLCEKHSDCEFLCFTNSTLIDEEFADEMARVHNFIPAISLEGFEEATDARRGEGTYQKVIHAMDILRSKHLIFGISCCYTSANFESITSEAYYDKMIELGAMFVWYFHYMPVGNDAHPELLPTPEQRTEMYKRIRDYRNRKPLFAMDFQNDAEYVGGCIAGGRRYLHINANGDVDPCVFIHYSDSNIREKTLLEALCSPMFMAYHDGQPFNENMLRPCPMLENPEKLREMVTKAGAHSTDPQSPESVEHLCSKCDQYAKNWSPVSEKLWYGSKGEARYLAKKAYLDHEKAEKRAQHAASKK